ncbi:MAG: glycosyltransferase family 1 protein [Moorea sp. SIO2B7]|nr:glycosyltransferase family 1 protein [Moorena sp. SIO2B7]
MGRLPKLRSRTRIIKKFLKELKQRNIQVELYTKNLHGQQRKEVLNRSKILLNVLRHPFDSTGDCLILGAANKTLLVSETMVDSVPFEPNKHIIQVPVNQMADTIIYYLENEEERQKIVNAAYDLVREDLTMKNAI